MNVTHEQIGWLKTLAAAYRQEHDWDGDDDPDATHEMLESVRCLASALEQQLTPEREDELPAVPCDDSEIPF